EHLAAMGFDGFLSEVGQPEIGSSEAFETSGVVVPLRSASDSGGEQAVSQLLWDQLHEKVDPQVLAALSEGVWEMVANGLEHSGADAAVMAQVYRADRGGRPPDHDDKVQVVIADIGRGIRASLASSPAHEPASDIDAIDLALEYLVTSVYEDRGRGQGLSTTLEQVTGLGGKMVIRSGAGKVVVENGDRQREEVPGLPGTIVALSLPLYPG
ncbi:MAG TPA: ATP-binding protein, partial [Solirubrobacterales bacterium]|nr:ATP-binding protein [Solirubrobacterales bacterium]